MTHSLQGFVYEILYGRQKHKKVKELAEILGAVLRSSYFITAVWSFWKQTKFLPSRVAITIGRQ